MNHQILNKQGKKRQLELTEALSQNTNTIVAMTAEEFLDYAIKLKQQKGWSTKQITDWMDTIIQAPEIPNTVKEKWPLGKPYIKATGSITPAIVDTMTLSKLARDMHKSGGIFTEYYIKTIGKTPQIVFKGYPGLRTHLNGTKYLKTNLKIVSLGVGKLGGQNAIKGGIIISVVFSIAFQSIEQVLNDKATWKHFVAGLSYDVVTALIGGAITWSAITAYTSAATAMVAVGPMVIIVAFGIGFTIGFSALDKHYGITEKIAAELTMAEQRLIDTNKKTKNQFRRALKYANEDPSGFMRSLFGIPYLPNTGGSPY